MESGSEEGRVRTVRSLLSRFTKRHCSTLSLGHDLFPTLPPTTLHHSGLLRAMSLRRTCTWFTIILETVLRVNLPNSWLRLGPGPGFCVSHVKIDTHYMT
jgi:hypothetical protein